jgi:hypothetical protein
MQYFAGLFDAEGYVSLCPKGSFTVAIEMANEDIPNILQSHFQGKIYKRKREDRKITWTWRINSINDHVLNFIKIIKPFSVVKTAQLSRLEDYLDQSREDRKATRAITCSTLKDFKQPLLELHHILPRIEKPIEPLFFGWLAGFIDGDGNFVCNEYTDNRTGKKYFAHQISVANIFLESISYINNRIPGCISNLNRSKNKLYKWTCNRNAEKFLANSILPFLMLKKVQCDLFLQFLNFPKKPYGIGYSIEDQMKMYEIIKQIKHQNSL